MNERWVNEWDPVSSSSSLAWVLPRQLERNEKSLPPTGVTGSMQTAKPAHHNASAWWT
jgi:hypothetical protein